MAENIGTVRQPLVAGVIVRDELIEDFGLLAYGDGSGSCSASLLRNDWVVSAAHCVELTDAAGNMTPDPTRPGQNMLKPIASMTLTAGWDSAQTRQAVRVVTFRPYDIALVQLAAPFTVHGSTTGYQRLVFQGGQFPLFGDPRGAHLLVFGRGIYQFASGEGAAATPSLLDGKYRMGYARVNRNDGELYWYPSENGQMIAGGDSGGPSFAWVLGGYALVGVHALTRANYVAGKPSTGWMWVTSTPEGADAPIMPVWKQMWQIMGPPQSAPDMREPFPPTGNVGTFAASPPDFQPMWVYAVQPNGELVWYRKDSNAAVWQGPRTVGVGWNGLKDVIAAGGNRFYVLTSDDKLMWFQHDGFNSGEFKWKGGIEVGHGWSFKRIFAGGDGVIYAIRDDGKLFWYRHLGYRDGSNQWSEAKEVGSGWGDFKDVFSLGGGAVYAVQADGTLLLYQQKGFETGAKDWYPPRGVGTGWNQFQQIVPVGNGVILGIRPDGALIWYKHLGMTDGGVGFGRLKDRWETAVTIGSGWQHFAKVFAIMPTTPDPVR
ncbi:tachylectin-related carbohydrate-binding protein [Microbacterium sp. P5_E9]